MPIEKWNKTGFFWITQTWSEEWRKNGELGDAKSFNNFFWKVPKLKENIVNQNLVLLSFYKKHRPRLYCVKTLYINSSFSTTLNVSLQTNKQTKMWVKLPLRNLFRFTIAMFRLAVVVVHLEQNDHQLTKSQKNTVPEESNCWCCGCWWSCRSMTLLASTRCRERNRTK